MGDLKTLRGRNKAYTLTSGWMVGEVDGHAQVPVTVEGGCPRSFGMLLAAEPGPATVRVALLFHDGEAVRPDQLWLHLNDTPLGHAGAIEPVSESTRSARRAVFTAPAGTLRDGPNTISLRAEGVTLTVVSIDVSVVVS
jgi:hypothetical protein